MQSCPRPPSDLQPSLNLHAEQSGRGSLIRAGWALWPQTSTLLPGNSFGSAPWRDNSLLVYGFTLYRPMSSPCTPPRSVRQACVHTSMHTPHAPTCGLGLPSRGASAGAWLSPCLPSALSSALVPGSSCTIAHSFPVPDHPHQRAQILWGHCKHPLGAPEATAPYLHSPSQQRALKRVVYL